MILLSVFLCFPLRFHPALAQETEVVANLATGRVVIYVAKDGMALAAVEQPGEAESRMPAVIELSRRRVAVLLGAVEWEDLGAGTTFRVARELPNVLTQAGTGPRLRAEHAEDIEALGIAVLELLRTQTSRLHRKLDLREDEPLFELLLVGYVEDYGPEVWSLTYRVAQEPVRGNYWRTRILRPRYAQLYPPDKGQPKTLVEVRFPAESGGAPLAERLRVEPECTTLRDDPKTGAWVLKGEANKARIEEATAWMRALLNTTSPPNARQAFLVIHERGSFEWVLRPPEAPERTTEQPREPGAPTLRKKP